MICNHYGREDIMHLLRTSCFALSLALLSPAFAQTVTPPSAPANCVQNAGNQDLACGASSVAQPGTGTTALGI
jgi:hypothetical protein